MKNALRLFCILSAASIFIFSGCATVPIKMPSNYLSEEHDISVEVVHIKDKASLRDSGSGGLIGLVAKAVRSGGMEEIFGGIQGETVKELLRQQIENNLDEVFYIEEESEDLVLELNITQWGWFIPTTVLGIKTGGYQLEIIGQIAVYDLTMEKKLLMKTFVSSQQPLGKEPTSEETNKALMLAIADFSKKAANSVVQNY